MGDQSPSSDRGAAALGLGESREGCGLHSTFERSRRCAQARRVARVLLVRVHGTRVRVSCSCGTHIGPCIGHNLIAITRGSARDGSIMLTRPKSRVLAQLLILTSRTENLRDVQWVHVCNMIIACRNSYFPTPHGHAPSHTRDRSARELRHVAALDCHGR